MCLLASRRDGDGGIYITPIRERASENEREREKESACARMRSRERQKHILKSQLSLDFIWLFE